MIPYHPPYGKDANFRIYSDIYTPPPGGYANFFINGGTRFEGEGVLSGVVRVNDELQTDCIVSLYSEDTQEFLQSTATNASGEFIFEGLNTEELFYIVAKEPSNAWEYRISSRRRPIPVYAPLSVQGSFETNEDMNGVDGAVVVLGGQLPLSVEVIDPLPYGLEPAINRRTLTIVGTSYDVGVWESVVRVTASNGMWVDVPVQVEIQVPTDPHFDKVSLLLHMDGTDGSAAFTDNSPMPKMVTAYGNAKISTAQSKFGGASAYFDGNGDYLEITASSHFGFGTADFTIEFWVCPVSLPTNVVKVIYDQRAALSDELPTLLTYTDGNVIYSTASQDRIVSSAGALAVGVYTHVAIARASGVTRLFINGHLSGASWPDATNYANSRPVIGGAGDFPSGTYNINGYIDELRITKGVARYTENFTLPDKPFPDR